MRILFPSLQYYCCCCCGCGCCSQKKQRDCKDPPLTPTLPLKSHHSGAFVKIYLFTSYISLSLFLHPSLFFCQVTSGYKFGMRKKSGLTVTSGIILRESVITETQSSFNLCQFDSKSFSIDLKCELDETIGGFTLLYMPAYITPSHSAGFALLIMSFFQGCFLSRSVLIIKRCVCAGGCWNAT